MIPIEKFAGPLARGVSDPVLELFLLDLFDKLSVSMGPRRAKLYPLDIGAGGKSLQNRLVVLLGRSSDRLGRS